MSSEYTLPDGAKGADLTVSADDWYRLFVNGKEIGMGSDWSNPSTYDLLPSLKKGTNVIAFEVRNKASAGGLAVRVRTTLKDGKTSDWVSDAAWKCSKKAAKNWQTAPKAPKGFEPAVVLGKMGDKPWGMVISGKVEKPTKGFVDVTKDFSVAKGFKLEKIYNVPKDKGSWVAMTMDDKGRFYCANQGGKIYRVTVGEKEVKVLDS